MPDDDIIERFCHNAPFVEVFKTRSLKEEESRDLSDDIFELVDDEMYECNGGDMDLHPFKFYLLFRAADSFHEEHGQYPGWTDDTVEEDRKKITSHIAKILSSHQLEEDYLNDNHANEIVRYGGSEIHPVAAFVGGVLAQEATKMITHQFQLLQSTFVYNGLCGSSERFDL
jgi:NEDD8-activating enzyme E1 regulatory subunit